MNWIHTCSEKKVIWKEFWNRMKWIKLKTKRGLLNQKYSSGGFTLLAASLTPVLVTLLAKPLITCFSLAPTRSRICHYRASPTCHFSIKATDQDYWLIPKGIKKKIIRIAMFIKFVYQIMWQWARLISFWPYLFPTSHVYTNISFDKQIWWV